MSPVPPHMRTLVTGPVPEEVTSVSISTKNMIFFEGVPQSDALHILDMVASVNRPHLRAAYTGDGELESVQIPATALLNHIPIYEKYPYIEIGLAQAQDDDIVHLQL